MNATSNTAQYSDCQYLQSKAYTVYDKVKCPNSPVGEYSTGLPESNFAVHPVSSSTSSKLFT